MLWLIPLAWCLVLLTSPLWANALDVWLFRPSFTIRSNEGYRTPVAPEDEAAFLAQREAIRAYRDRSK